MRRFRRKPRGWPPRPRRRSTDQIETEGIIHDAFISLPLFQLSVNDHIAICGKLGSLIRIKFQSRTRRYSNEVDFVARGRDNRPGRLRGKLLERSCTNLFWFPLTVRNTRRKAVQTMETHVHRGTSGRGHRERARRPEVDVIVMGSVSPTVMHIADHRVNTRH